MNKKNPVPRMDPEFLYLLLTPTVQNIEIQIRVYSIPPKQICLKIISISAVLASLETENIQFCKQM